jgi:hypothetical protein
MTKHYFIRCLKYKPRGHCDFLHEWYPTHDAMAAAVREHQCRDWDSIDWGYVTGARGTRAVAGGWNMPLHTGTVEEKGSE